MFWRLERPALLAPFPDSLTHEPGCRQSAHCSLPTHWESHLFTLFACVSLWMLELVTELHTSGRGPVAVFLGESWLKNTLPRSLRWTGELCKNLVTLHPWKEEYFVSASVCQRRKQLKIITDESLRPTLIVRVRLSLWVGKWWPQALSLVIRIIIVARQRPSNKYFLLKTLVEGKKT